MNCRIPFVAMLLLAFAQTATAQEDTLDEVLFAPGADVSELIGDGGFSLPGSANAGGALKRFANKWPSDLVIAPVPGRSPQVGWSLALGAGYFLDSGNEESDVAPSVLGGFAWFAENDSYAFGVGSNLHLLDDNLRVKLGAGYLDIRYSYYGIGEDNDLDISVDILQEAPLSFDVATGQEGTEYYFGVGESF